MVTHQKNTQYLKIKLSDLSSDDISRGTCVFKEAEVENLEMITKGEETIVDTGKARIEELNYNLTKSIMRSRESQITLLEDFSAQESQAWLEKRPSKILCLQRG